MSRFGAFFADRLSVAHPLPDYSSREKYQNYRIGIQAPAGNSMGKKLPIFWLNVFPFSHVYSAVDKFNYLLILMNDPAASYRVSDLAYSNNLSCLREVLGCPCFWT